VSADEAAASVRDVPAHDATFGDRGAMSGVAKGSGKLLLRCRRRAAAGEVLHQDAGAGRQRAAVAGPDGRGELQPGGIRRATLTGPVAEWW